MAVIDSGAGQQTNPLEELLRLQGNFHHNLEQATISYLRQLQGMTGPVVPGTMVDVLDSEGVSAAVAPGGTAHFEISVENRQRVHTLVTPMLSLLVADSGTTWFPNVETFPTSKLLATDESCVFTFTIEAPRDAPSGVYRGACLLYGCIKGVVPVAVTVGRRASASKKRKSAPTRKKQSRRSPRVR
jgi:hypothetical protein